MGAEFQFGDGEKVLGIESHDFLHNNEMYSMPLKLHLKWLKW